MKLKNSILKLICSILLIVLVAVGIYFFADDILKAFLWVLWLFLPFILAYLLSSAVNPLVTKLENKIKIPRQISAIFVILLLIGVVGGIVFAVGWKIVEEVQELYGQLPGIIEKIQWVWSVISESFLSMFSKLPEGVQNAGIGVGSSIVNSAGKILENNYMPMVHGIGNAAMALPKIFIWIVVFVLSLYFMISDPKTMRKVICGALPKRFLVRMRKIRRELKRYLGGYIKAQLIIMSIASLIIMVGLSIMKIEYAVLIAICIAIFDALPFFGSGAVLWPWAIVCFITGDYIRGIGLIIIYISVICTRQFIEPKIVSENIGIYPVFTLMSMYFGFKILSVGGMILGPIILIFIVSLYKAGALDGIVKFTKGFFGKMGRYTKDIINYFEKK